MNAKKERKIQNRTHVYDDFETWFRGDFTQAPWSKEKIASFQKRLDSAFGGENAIVLVWSGDRSYGDTFLDENGVPYQKPVLLFHEEKINDKDFYYVSAPRWLLMEVNHGSQLEASWEGSSWVTDGHGLPHRIRPEKPPEFFYTHLRVIAQHDEGITSSGAPPCCRNMWEAGRRVCYGKYREPNETDIAFVGRIRENMDRDGVAQRNDAPRDAKTLLKGKLAANHFMKQSAIQHAEKTKQMLMANPGAFFQSILDKRGSTMSAEERNRIVEQAIDEMNEERFARL